MYCIAKPICPEFALAVWTGMRTGCDSPTTTVDGVIAASVSSAVSRYAYSTPATAEVSSADVEPAGISVVTSFQSAVPLSERDSV